MLRVDDGGGIGGYILCDVISKIAVSREDACMPTRRLERELTIL